MRTLPPSLILLAVEVLQRCAFDEENRAGMEEMGIEETLRNLLKVWKQQKDRGEEAIRLVRAFSETLDTMNGKFDVIDIPKDDDEHDMTELPCFNAFISHKRSDAQDFARTIFSMLKGKKYSCFLDVDTLEGVNDLDMLVAGSDVFILFSVLMCLHLSGV